MATLDYCLAANGDVEETPAYSRLPANMLMFTTSNVDSGGKVRQITHGAFPLSLRTRHQIENPHNADQLRPAAKISPASMIHIQARGKVVPRRDNPRHVLPTRCQATGNSDYFWQGPVILQCVGETTAQLNHPACAGSGHDTWSRTSCPGIGHVH